MRTNEKYSEKEIAIFNGIVELLDQGRQIHDLKVSDISAAAGIGKSTAYEYFSSKEDILRQATRYHVIREYEALSSFVTGHKSFIELLEQALDYIVDMLGNRFPSLLIMFMSLDSSEVELLISEDCELISELQSGVNQLFETVRLAGLRDGLINKSIDADDSRFVISGMLSAFFQEIRFLFLHDKNNEQKMRQCRERTIRLMLKTLK
ncbi:MAG: TetR/AcrR family transcriptional regulator [Clostridiaceae bacterium]|nr:TetR/AcrR family transcriptional regulator [Clostridiaceae bacterium]